jgi:hypothetical protein
MPIQATGRIFARASLAVPSSRSHKNSRSLASISRCCGGAQHLRRFVQCLARHRLGRVCATCWQPTCIDRSSRASIWPMTRERHTARLPSRAASTARSTKRHPELEPERGGPGAFHYLTGETKSEDHYSNFVRSERNG